jgi:hypothetical protein
MFHILSKANKADQMYFDFLTKKKELMKELKGMFDSKDSMVTLKTLRSLEFSKWYYSDDKTVKFKLIRLTEAEAVFISVIEPIEGKPARYGLQKHDCIERGIVVEGHLIDDVNNLKLKSQETWEYKKNQRHQPYATIKSVYEVVFSEK